MSVAPRGPRTAVLAAALAVAIPLRPANAALVVPMSAEALDASAAAVVLGCVAATHAAIGAADRIVTRVALRSSATRRGASLPPVVVLEEPGGRIGDRSEVVRR